jgi:hypothetical protein
MNILITEKDALIEDFEAIKDRSSTPPRLCRNGQTCRSI